MGESSTWSESSNDPFFSRQWALYQESDHDIDAPEGWNIERGDSSVIVAIIDTGVLFSHPDLGEAFPYTDGNIWINWTEYYGVEGVDDDGNSYVDDVYGWDFVDLTDNPPLDPVPGEDYYDQDSIPSDFCGHGTHCAGIIAAMSNNFSGISGVAGGWYVPSPPQMGCRIMCLRAGWTEGDTFYMGVEFCAQAIVYATDMGASVINYSRRWSDVGVWKSFPQVGMLFDS